MTEACHWSRASVCDLNPPSQVHRALGTPRARSGHAASVFFVHRGLRPLKNAFADVCVGLRPPSPRRPVRFRRSCVCVIRHSVDIAVRDLPGLAEEDYELPGEPVHWAVAVGLLEGVFLPPSRLPDDWLEPAVLAKLPAGVQLYRWLVAEKVARDDAQRIACRRAMKALSPRLMKEVVGRR